MEFDNNSCQNASNFTEKGKCLTCRYFSCKDGTAWCHVKGMRQIYTSHISDEERETIKSQAIKKVICAKKNAETLEKLLNRVNPSWCIFRQYERKLIIK